MKIPFFVTASQLAVVVVSAINVSPSFENTAIIKTVELGGSSVHVTTTYTSRSLSKSNAVYYFSIPRHQDDRTSWLEAKLKGAAKPLAVDKHGIEALLATTDPVVYYSINLPRPLGVNDTLSLIVSAIESHPSSPLPALAKQTDKQSLLYETNAYISSPYKTVNQRTKIKSPTPDIHSYSNPPSLSRFAIDAPVTKSGASVTYGPFRDISSSDSKHFADSVQETIKIHYQYDSPVLTVAKLRRAAEISHWGANLNIQDDIHLRNDGPRLEGHFSRLAHQQQAYFQKRTGNSLLSFVLHLPSGARDVYYTDIVGNVSTSKFRPAPANSKTRSGVERASTLEVRPRYPLLGGWNYTFTLGWDAPLEDSARYDPKLNEYIIAIPFFTYLPGSVVDDAEFKVILPEGASDVKLFTPFPVDSIARDTHVTYLDTTGRPSIILNKKHLTEKHTGLVYVSYRLSTTAHLTKVAAVTTAFALLFSLMYAIRRVDMRLTKS